MRFLPIILSLTFIFSTGLPASGKNMAFEKLSALSRAEIIEYAALKVKEKHPDFRPGFFPRIRVFKDSSSVSVIFEIPVRFVPPQSKNYYQITKIFEPKNDLIFAQSSKNPDNYSIDAKATFIEYTKPMRAQIEFVLRMLNHSKKLPFTITEPLHKDLTVDIYERPLHYDIYLENPEYLYILAMDRKTGIITQFKADPKKKKDSKDIEEIE